MRTAASRPRWKTPTPTTSNSPRGSSTSSRSNAAEALLPEAICALGQPLDDVLPAHLIDAVRDASHNTRAVDLAGRSFQVLARPLSGSGAMRGRLVLLVERPVAAVTV